MLAGLLVAAPLSGVQASPVVNLETTMKNMGLAYKQAHRAEDIDSLLPRLAELAELTETAKQAPFPADKADLYRQGLREVLAAINAAEQAALANDHALAQQRLQQVDELRKQYHKERRVSWWHILFGGA
nr:cytochrome b562 [Zobellella iuensis]